MSWYKRWAAVAMTAVMMVSLVPAAQASELVPTMQAKGFPRRMIPRRHRMRSSQSSVILPLDFLMNGLKPRIRHILMPGISLQMGNMDN